ncbi:MAG: glutamate racemase [Patescibacteria group bacterium]
MLGIFDSGIGGLTVVRELLKRSPQTSFVYLGDTARWPYGNKAPETVQRYALEDAQFLIDRGATDIVVACNTASALALDQLRTAFPTVRFFDVISPAISAVQSQSWKRVGVIGTRATIGSRIYEMRLKEERPSLEVLSVACPLFVPLAEENWGQYPETKRIARRYLAPLRQKQIEALILGCTHYPLLVDVIKASLQQRVHIVDSPSALLDDIQRDAPEILDQHGTPEQRFFFTDVSAHTDAVASRWLGRTIKGERAEI